MKERKEKKKYNEKIGKKKEKYQQKQVQYKTLQKQI